MGSRLVCVISVILLSASLSGCGMKTRHALNEVEEILDERPAEALSILDLLEHSI